MLSESWNLVNRSWQNYRMAHLSTGLVVTLIFTLVLVLYLLVANFQRSLTLWGGAQELTVYLEDNLPEKHRKKIEAEMRDLQEIESIRFVSKENALAEFRKVMGSWGGGLLEDLDMSSPLPESYYVRLAAASMPLADSLKEFAGRLSQLAGVEDVSYGQQWLEHYGTFVRVGGQVLWLLILVLVVSGGFIISHLVSHSMIGRRQEIEILELIGATSRFIRAPFMIEGAWLGAICMLVALTATYVSFYAFYDVLQKDLSFLGLANYVRFFSLPEILFFVLTGPAVGFLATYLNVRQLNDGWLAQRDQREQA